MKLARIMISHIESREIYSYQVEEKEKEKEVYNCHSIQCSVLR